MKISALPLRLTAIAAIAWLGSRYIVKGNSKAIAIPELRPGKAPIRTPVIVEPNIKANVLASIINEMLEKKSINRNC